jgi:hypothetical protein
MFLILNFWRSPGLSISIPNSHALSMQRVGGVRLRVERIFYKKIASDVHQCSIDSAWEWSISRLIAMRSPFDFELPAP